MSKILIVENTAITALRLKLELEAAGYGITDCVSTATDAIQSLNEQLPDLVLLDFHLDHNETGSTVAQYINENFQLPIIYLSQYADDATIQHIDKTSFYAYLTKPFKPNALLLTVRQALATQKATPTTPPEKVVFTAEHVEHTLPADNILWITTLPATKGIFITTTTKENQFRVYETLKDFLTKRELTSFIQISSSCIVNLKAVAEVIGRESIVIAAHNLPFKRNQNLDKTNGNRLFKIGKTYRKCVPVWKKQWM
ncbi:MAG: response regulator transcription factor [Saprospiraceae bacterium]